MYNIVPILLLSVVLICVAVGTLIQDHKIAELREANEMCRCEEKEGEG